MGPRTSHSLGGALAAATLVLAACSGAPTAAPTSTATLVSPTSAPVATAAPASAAPTTAVAVPTLKPTVEGVQNGRIAYAIRSASGANLFSILPDGTDERQLTTGASNSLCAAYSADGTKIAYCGDASGNFEIWTMLADGTKQAQLTHLKGRALFPDFSPNGKLVAFGGVEGTDPRTQVYVVDATAGDHLVALTTCKDAAASCSNDYPAWSPDGKSIVFIHTDDYNGETPVNSQVWVMDADGGNQRAITTGATPKDQVPSWSPDGKFIVFSSGVLDSEGIWVMAADGSGVSQLSGCLPSEPTPCAAGDDFGPVWSPDGTLIAFLRAFGAVGANDRPVYVMNADGTDQRRLREGTSLDTVPAWQAIPTAS